MFFQIDPHNGLAIYDQIVRQVKFAVADGTLRPGDLIPSVRDLARRLAVNPNTVAKAYGTLRVESVLSGVRGMGLEVTRQAPRRCRSERLRLIRERLRSVLREATQSGLDQQTVRSLIDEELSVLNSEEKS